MLIDARDLAWFLAGLFSGIALVVLLRPRLGRLYAGRTAATLLKAPLIIAALIVVFAIALFVWLMSPGPPAGAAGEAVSTQANAPASAPSAPASAASMDELLQGLESRLATQGGTDADWELLAQTYQFVGRTDDAKLARAHKLSPAATSSDQTSAPASATAPAAISGNVDLAAALKGKVPDGLTLFIVAKSLDSPGPPVAIIRTTTGRWPLAFTLDDSNSMIPGRNLSGAKRVSIEARVSPTGGATPQPGDFQSSIATIDAHQSTPIRIVIDHVIG
jgi:hypothetical protein